MKVSDAFPSKYLKADDLKGRRIPVTIERVSFEHMDDEQKAIVHFRGVAKPLVLNRTNAGSIALIVGTDEMDEWPGRAVQLYGTPTMFQGKMTLAIRIEAPPQAQARGTVAPPLASHQTGSYDPGPFPPNTPAAPDAFPFGANAAPDNDDPFA